MIRVPNRSLVLALLLGACAPARPAVPPSTPEPVQVAGDTTTRPSLRPVPVPAAYRAALAKGTRSETGAPGAEYWQQNVRYQIDAELDPATETLRGSERIVYRNRSPEALSSLYLNLYQNVFSEGVPRNRHSPVTGGTTLESVRVTGQPLPALQPAQLRVRQGERPPAGYVTQGTLARLVLPEVVAPGDSVVLEVKWRQKVPPQGTYRTAWEDALGGRVFQVAQWYPQIATFDDVYGWDATPYLGDGEFYLEYGDFDVNLTLPAGWVVGATGELRNPGDVLTPEAQRRLAGALRTDDVTRVVTEADLRAGRATQPSRGGELTWRFRAENVRDFAFAASDRYLWDVKPAEIAGDGEPRTIPVHAFYRPGAPGWEEAARYGEESVEMFSERLIPYIYPQLTVTEGPIYGMEYPMLVFIARPTEAEDLFGVIAHEVAHEWFPMMIGQNEAAYAWMDEGPAEFLEALALERYFPASDPFAGDLASYLRVAGTEAEVPLMRHTDLVSPYGARTVAAYTKPSVLLRSLRTMLGEEAFEEAIRTYAREWLLKHPYPWDFFNTVERVSGRELDWFFYPWWYETGTLDQAIGGVEAVDPNRLRVTVHDLGDIPVPAFVVGTTAAGERIVAEVPIETWLGGTRSAVVMLEADAPIVRVEVDPEQIFPDVERENNLWTAP